MVKTYRSASRCLQVDLGGLGGVPLGEEGVENKQAVAVGRAFRTGNAELHSVHAVSRRAQPDRGREGQGQGGGDVCVLLRQALDSSGHV